MKVPKIGAVVWYVDAFLEAVLEQVEWVKWLERRYKIDRKAIAKDVTARLKVQEEGEEPASGSAAKKKSAQTSGKKKAKK